MKFDENPDVVARMLFKWVLIGCVAFAAATAVGALFPIF